MKSQIFRQSFHPPGGDVVPLLASHNAPKGGTQNNGELTVRLNPKRADYLKIKEFTMKNIPDTDTMSRLSLSEKGWKGSGLPEMGLTLSTLEYLASNWGLSSSWFTTHISVWTIELPDEAITPLFISCRSDSEDMLHECGLKLWGDQLWERIHIRIQLMYLLLLPVNEIPVVSQFCSPPFPELQEYGGCRGRLGINHITDQHVT